MFVRHYCWLCFRMYMYIYSCITAIQHKIKRSGCISKSQRTLCISFSQTFWVVQIPFVCMVKFKLLAQFPVDHLLRPVMLCIYYYYSLIRTFHISISQWFFTGVWVTASLLKSPGLFSVFWPFSIMLSFGWSPLVRQLPSPPVPFVTL